MPDKQQAQPMITVRKADGATVRMTLDEVRKMRKQTQNVGAVAVALDKKEEKKEDVAGKPVEKKQEIKEQIKQERTEKPKQEDEVKVPKRDDAKKQLLEINAKQDLKDDARRLEKSGKAAGEAKPEKKSYVASVKKKKKSAAWSRDDYMSLLDEELGQEELAEEELKQISTHDHIIDEVLQEFPKTISPEAQMRARSLIVSFFKGVRDKHQFHEYVIQKVEDGGLGLNDEEAARLVLVMEDNIREFENSVKEHIKLKRVSLKKFEQQSYEAGNFLQLPKESASSSGEKIAISPARSLSSTTPVTNIFVDEAVARIAEIGKNDIFKAGAKRPEDALKKGVAEPMSIDESAGIRGVSRAVADNKQAMHDIAPPEEEKRAVGPVEEMERFGLIDFRRLSDDASHAAKIFSGKFDGWKEESFLLYSGARQAWFRSPLYSVYQKIVLDSINSEKNIKETVISSDSGMTMEEFIGVIEVNKGLK